jgi:cysteine synthase
VTDRRQNRDVTVIDLIGNTPLLRLKRFENGLHDVELYGKAEWFNPGGSVKDRPAANMVKEGVRSGALRAGKTLLDATSGNTGIAYAMLGASMGFPVKLCVPSNVTVERKRLLHAYGAEMIFTDPMDGSDGAIREARVQVAAATIENLKRHRGTASAKVCQQLHTSVCALSGAGGFEAGQRRHDRRRKIQDGIQHRQLRFRYCQWRLYADRSHLQRAGCNLNCPNHSRRSGVPGSQLRIVGKER